MNTLQRLFSLVSGGPHMVAVNSFAATLKAAARPVEGVMPVRMLSEVAPEVANAARNAQSKRPAGLQQAMLGTGLQLWVGGPEALAETICGPSQNAEKILDDIGRDANGLYLDKGYFARNGIEREVAPVIFIAGGSPNFDKVFCHELGHHIDYSLGLISQSEEFNAAFEKDLKQLTKKITSSLTPTFYMPFKHYLPQPWGAHDKHQGLKECFAELVAYAIIPERQRREGFDTLMPNSFALVQKITAGVEASLKVATLPAYQPQNALAV